MSTANVIVRYDGPILSNHQMDVADLAPALIGLSDLCKLTNKKFNGDRSSVKVLIKADIEQKCIQFDLQIVQTVWSQTRNLISSHDVSSAKEVLEWLGILIGGPGGVYGFIRLIRWLDGRAIVSTELEVKDGKDVTRITVVGNNNNVAFAHPQAVELMREEAALSSIKKVVQPVTKEGYESLEFESDSAVEKVSKSEAAKIINLESSEIQSSIDQPQIITA